MRGRLWRLHLLLPQRQGATVEDQRLLANAYTVEGTIQAMMRDTEPGLEKIRKAISILPALRRDR